MLYLHLLRIRQVDRFLTLVEKAQEAVDLADAEKMQEKILTAKFDFDDFLKQTRLMKNMGSLAGMVKMIPGMNKIGSDQLSQAESKLKQAESAISSMTMEERKDPDLLATVPGRRRRIARGAGLEEKDVSQLISDFQRMRNLMQQMGQGNMPGMGGMNPFAGMMGGGGMPGGGMPGMGGGMPQQGFRGYNQGGGRKKKKKQKKRKGFGDL